MKKIIVLLILVSLFLATTAIAQEEIPARYMPILESWNATTVEELYQNILAHFQASAVGGASHFNEAQMPLNIRFGGTTEELIADKDNWDLAIVSSKEVDLQAMADIQLINLNGFAPQDGLAIHHWLLPENLQALLPNDPLMMHYVYVYDYDEQTDDATLMICQNTLLRKGSYNRYRSPGGFAREMLKRRSADSVRSLEGIRRVNAWTKEKKNDTNSVDPPDGLCPIDIWTEDELIANADDWDAAIIVMGVEDKLEGLDEAGLLYHFDDDSYFASRIGIKSSGASYLDVPSGIFNADGKMISIPCDTILKEYSTTTNVLILNAKSDYLELAQKYALHYIKSVDWFQTTPDKMWPHGNDICMYKDELDW